MRLYPKDIAEYIDVRHSIVIRVIKKMREEEK